ncbi:MAG: phage head-tail connector protein [Proteobacteria bacterium]|nr:phage head-tail connector protein [Pseudomonadota bacterium]
MNPTLVTAPSVEPVTLAEAKEHLKIDHADEDTYITNLITAARRFCEKYTRLALIEQTWKWTFDHWPGIMDVCDETLPLTLRGGDVRFVEVPVTPLISVTSITTYDDQDTATVWAASNYYTSSPQGRIYRRTGASWPSSGRAGDGIEFVFKAGFGTAASDVPTPLRQGLLQLIAHLYENRVAAGDTSSFSVPFSVTENFNLYKRISL